ncbi:DUF4906 domain-containing protein [Parabacteroides faecis]|uniref:BACON domain-containing protein n=1 Tax=Parabacteroides TaxID=375288 RepID=UPI000EFF9D59|nr:MULTISPECIES: BACON domain-containing carbohydrate-binding protein [Parabacteroides]MBC8618521.1 DUF4906 domain-containing protein [Parabacteroides faecis]RHR94772.1 DUF4906 domain-containing protein [Parabacteroides sp. AF14-59]
MKRVNKAWSLVLLLLLFAGSCTQTDVEENEIPPHALKDVDAGFNLNVLANRIPVTRSITFTADGSIESDTLTVGVRDSVQTKATTSLSEAQESQIASLWVGQYDVTTGLRLFNQYLPSLTATTVNLKLKHNQNGNRSRVYFVSNAGDLGAIADETILKKHILTYTPTNAGLPANDLCQMVGMWEGEVLVGGIRNITVELTRLIAKIEFTYSTGAELSFTPTSVVLKNAPAISLVEVPTGQLADISYETYTGTVSPLGATVYWYLPENMAGTVDGPDAVDSEKKKIGTGVTNATCIELTGDAVQGGVRYSDVTFRFFPGSNMNNYDVIRNAHYTMTVTLLGIDISDERITVGGIPPIEVDPGDMPANKGGEKEIQITARPGQQWVFDMPAWLSALLNGQHIPSGATITYQGPANVVFKAEEANPRAESRSVSFNININDTSQSVTITQSGSTLAKGNDILLNAEAGSGGASSFTATEGLQWLATLSGDGWLDWATTNPGTSGSEALAGVQTLEVEATTCNPLAQERIGKITVKAGASVGDPGYTDLKQEITVRQEGSTVTGSTVNMSAEAAVDQASAFIATSGLSWIANVTNGDWITLSGATSGSLTTGSAQNITFEVSLNPFSTLRSGEITVRAGDPIDGPTGTIAINQDPSSFSTTNATTVIDAAATRTSAGLITATAGLAWTISPETSNGITVSPISGSGNDSLTFTASVNTGAERTGIFTVAVTEAPTRTVTVTANQEPEIPAYLGAIQVCKTEVDGRVTFSYANSYCSNLVTEERSDWRIPTLDELKSMWTNRNALERISGFTPFVRYYYWSVSTGGTYGRWVVSLGNGDVGSDYDYNSNCIRCVRTR